MKGVNTWIGWDGHVGLCSTFEEGGLMRRELSKKLKPERAQKTGRQTVWKA